jgi:drug/metabolite transporter (DMT)-like permease
MTAGIGIALAFVAMLSWGFGDFMIQKSTRKVGDWETLFIITAFGTIVLLPFVLGRLPLLLQEPKGLLILLGGAIILTGAAIFQLESFRKGKLAVVEPILPFEIPAAAVMAFLVLGDAVTAIQFALIGTLIIGLCLVSYARKGVSKRILAEKGIYLGLIGAALMGFADFFLGWGSRVIDPIMANFVLDIVMAAVSMFYLLSTGRLAQVSKDLRTSPTLLITMSISDNVGWVAYAFAMSVVPIAVATGLSESSVIIAVMLGLFINREKLHFHQKIGLAVAVISALVLAAITSA